MDDHSDVRGLRVDLVGPLHRRLVVIAKGVVQSLEWAEDLQRLLTSHTRHLEAQTLYKAFYADGKKHVSRRALDMLTPMGLAIWYLDDGCYNKATAWP